MPQTIEAIYHDGIIELKEQPFGIKKARVLVTFPDEEEKYAAHTLDLNKVRQKKSTIDKLDWLTGKH
jgi:hypothetical protein